MKFFRPILIMITVFYCHSFLNTQKLYSLQKKRVAILDFTTDNVPKTYGRAVMNLFEIALYKTEAVDILERNQIEKILKEQGLQQSGCIDSSCAVEIGKILSADYVIIGSLTKIAAFNTTVKLVDIQTGLIKLADYKKSETSAELENSAEVLAQKFASAMGRAAVSKNIKKPASESPDEHDVIGKSDKNKKVPSDDYLFKVLLPALKEFNYSVDAGLIYFSPINKFGDGIEPGFGGKISAAVNDLFHNNLSLGIEFSYVKLKGDGSYINEPYYYSYYYSIQIDEMKIYTYQLFAGYKLFLSSHLSVSPCFGGSIGYYKTRYDYGWEYRTKKNTELFFTLGLDFIYSFNSIYVKFGISGGGIFEKYNNADTVVSSAGAGVNF